MFRSILYLIARFLGDASAIKKGRIGKRTGRRIIGRAVGKSIFKIFR